MTTEEIDEELGFTSQQDEDADLPSIDDRRRT
jgi:hypothetical protein